MKGEVNRAGVLLLGLRDERKLGEAWEALTWWRSLHARPLSAVATNLRYHVDRGDASVHGHIEVTQRLKRLDTLIGKLAREQGSVTQMHDIGGVRAVLPSMRHVFVLRRRLLKSWVIIKERDYVTTPKDSGYRALHLIVKRNGYPIEVQLRTVGQDIWANTVESVGREHGVEFKFGAGAASDRAFFADMAELIADFDRGELSPDDLQEGFERLPSLPIGQASKDDPNEPS